MLLLIYIYMGESYYYHHLSQYLPYSFLLNWHKVSNNSKHVQMLNAYIFHNIRYILKKHKTFIQTTNARLLLLWLQGVLQF